MIADGRAVFKSNFNSLTEIRYENREVAIAKLTCDVMDAQIKQKFSNL